MGDENASGNTNISCNALAVDGDGNLYIAMNVWDDSSDEYYIALYDKEGNGKGKVTLDGYSSSLVKLGDGSVATISWGNDGSYEMIPIDFASGKLKTDAQMKVPSDSVVVLDDKNVLMTESTSVYKYNIVRRKKNCILTGWTAIFPAQPYPAIPYSPMEPSLLSSRTGAQAAIIPKLQL